MRKSDSKLVHNIGQDMQEKAPDKLIRGQRGRTPPARDSADCPEEAPVLYRETVHHARHSDAWIAIAS